MQAQESIAYYLSIGMGSYPFSKQQVEEKNRERSKGA